jgi:hypothetical protein
LKKIKIECSWLLGLFGLPFFAVGFGFLILSVLPSLYDGWQMASWSQTTATLLHAQLTSSTSDGSTTYGIGASYRYRVNGRDYSNDRVAISGGSDNVGSFQQQLGSRLEHHYQNNLPVTVYYNPADPSEALLDRSLRWELIGFKLLFVVIFGGVGLGLIIFAMRGKRVIESAESREKPWLRRHEWADNRIRSGARTGLYVIWGFAIVWNLISSAPAFMITEIWAEQGPVALLVLLFPAVGLMLLGWAIKKSLEWRRFGVTPLIMDPFPGAIGGDVGGEILLNIPFDPQMVCEVTLSSLRSYISGSGKNRSRHETVEWQDSGYARVERAANGVRLLFCFAVPQGQRESEGHSDSYYLWRLNLKAELPGVDLDRDFEIPVYATGEHAKAITLDSTHEVPHGLEKLRAESLLPLRRNGMVQEIYYPMLRRPGRALLGMVFGVVFAGAGLFVWDKAADEGVPLYFMGGLFTLVGSIIVLGSLYSALNSLRVELDGHQLRVTRLVLGIAISSKQAAYRDVQAVTEKRGAMTSQQGNKHQIDYQVVAVTPQGELVLAEQLDSHSKARLVAAFFRQQLKVKDKGGESELVFGVE